MPTYEFRCPNGHEFDRFYRKISDAASELPCPACGAAATRQLSAGAGLLFKGSGFYLTDYGKNAHRKEPAGGGKSTEPKEGKGDAATTGSDAKAGDAKADKTGSTKPAGKKSTSSKSGGGDQG
jgi:putative FmdB family regulatory protein